MTTWSGNGGEAHGTRDWALRRGSDEQFQRHTARMLELEQEYLRRRLRRQAYEWRAVSEEATRLADALRGLVEQLEDWLDAQPMQGSAALPVPPPAAVSAAIEAIIATGSWSPDAHLDQLEGAPEAWMAEEKRAPAHRVTPATIDRAVEIWRGWFGGAHRDGGP